MPSRAPCALSRRAFVALSAGALALAAAPPAARAMGRTKPGGRITMHVPWATDAVDPHDLRDPAAAIFGGALFDSLFALDPAGHPYPTLAAAMPSAEAGTLVVRLREGLRTARGVALSGRDVLASITRAKERGAAALLADVPLPRLHPGEKNATIWRRVEPSRLAAILASPLLALVPRGFSPRSPDGTGAFLADTSDTRLALTRNPNAARGASFLDAVEVRRADDLRTSLRAFESERDDVGWLGMGLHASRKGAVRFDFGRAAWVVLATGGAAGSFGMPGVAQRLADALPEARLAHLGLGAPTRGAGDPGWGGPPADLVVDESSPHLVEVAETVAPILSRPGHEVTVAKVARAELARRRASGKAVLAIDLVRSIGPTPLDAIVALASSDDVARARDLVLHPPKFAPGTAASTLTRSLRLGILGEVRVAGGALPDIAFAAGAGEGWDLGASSRKPRR